MTPREKLLIAALKISEASNHDSMCYQGHNCSAAIERNVAELLRTGRWRGSDLTKESQRLGVSQ